MQVLQYKCTDYTITIKTSDIVGPWKRFYSRVPETARTYCDYYSTQKAEEFCLMKIDDLGKASLEVVDGETEWTEQPPVMFETETYHFFIEFNCGLNGTPMIVHPRRDIVESFDYHKGMLTGSINFLNSPGLFILAFEYVRSDGQHINDSLSLEVVSPKLDTKRDLDNIKKLINAEYENYVYDYLTLTFQHHIILQTNPNGSKIIWLSIFKQIVEPYFKACRYVMQHANKKAQKSLTYSKANRIKRWGRHEEEMFVERGGDAERFNYRNEVVEHTINTKENRFVKHTLLYLKSKFHEVFGDLLDKYGDEISDQEKSQMEEYETTFATLLNSKFFRSVGKYEGHMQESAVLQQRSGYRNIYRYWQMLKNGLSLEQGLTNIGMKQIWKLYEIWCFLVMKRLVFKIMDINPTDSSVSEKGMIDDDSSQMMESFEQKDIEYHLTIKKDNGPKVELWYQRQFDRNGSNEGHSVTTQQIPDIVLNVTPQNSKITKTYIFDAKYRVLDDKRNDTSTDEPVQDAINAMHRYRDAIYYGNKASKNGIDRPESKEVIGGYILFPGRVSDIDKLEDKYFTKSIKSINIGAYPLLPKGLAENAPLTEADLVECTRLEQDLQHMILDNEPNELLDISVPQKGLFYTDEEPKDAIVYVGFVKDSNPFYADFLENKAEMYYTGNDDTKPSLDIQRIKYFMPLVKGKVNGAYKVSAINAARKSDKQINNDNSNDGVRLFLMLGDFVSFGETKKTDNKLHNADCMTWEEAKKMYNELI